MNLAVIGSGGRKHAICYKLKQSPKLNELICIPGNAGTSRIAKNLDANIDKLNWTGGFFRKDIGWKLIDKK